MMTANLDCNIEEQRPYYRGFCKSTLKNPHWKCFLLSIMIMGCLGAIIWCRISVVKRLLDNIYTNSDDYLQPSPCDDGYIYIPIAFVGLLYLVYLVECWHSHTRIELQSKVDVNTVYDRIISMCNAVPIVWWKAISYHYVRRTRQVTRYRNGDAFTTTQVYYERVNTHSASSSFNFSHCGMKDISKILVDLEMYPTTKVRVTRGFSFATSDAEYEFEEQRRNFFALHENRDDYMETCEGLDLMNMTVKEYSITYADSQNLPWYVSQVVFWITSFILLSWPLRILIEYKTAYVHFHVHKLFGANYLNPYNYYSNMTRALTMDSSDFELNIRNNYSMVPSYSEAILMDVFKSESNEGKINGHAHYARDGVSNGGVVIANRGLLETEYTNYGSAATAAYSSTGDNITRDVLSISEERYTLSRCSTTNSATMSKTQRKKSKLKKIKKPQDINPSQEIQSAFECLGNVPEGSSAVDFNDTLSSSSQTNVIPNVMSNQSSSSQSGQQDEPSNLTVSQETLPPAYEDALHMNKPEQIEGDRMSHIEPDNMHTYPSTSYRIGCLETSL